jgi:hypothetical protein
MDHMNFVHNLWAWRILVVITQGFLVTHPCLCGCSFPDLERYALRIGALSEVDLRVQKDQDPDEEFGESMKLRGKKVVVNDADDEDDWD